MAQQPSAKKQSMSEIKLRRLTELNTRLREDLDRPRIQVSEACEALIAFTKATKDYMVPSIWGQVGKGEDPYAQQTQTSQGCCSCM